MNNLDYEVLIGLEFSTVCNINCTYCYARNNYQQDWQKEMKEDDFQKLFSFIELLSLKKKVKLVLLGGEPTRSKYFQELLTLKNVIFEVYTNLIDISNLIFQDNITYTVSLHTEYLNKIIKNLDILYNQKININIDLMLSKKFKPSHKLLEIDLNKYRDLFNIRIEVIEEVREQEINNSSPEEFLSNIKESTVFFKPLFDKYDSNYYNNFEEMYLNNKFCNMLEFNIDFYGNLKQTCSQKEFGNIFKIKDTATIDNLFKEMNSCMIFCKKGIVCPCDNLLKNTTKKIIKG